MSEETKLKATLVQRLVNWYFSRGRLAQIGIVFLLFFIGLQVSLAVLLNLPFVQRKLIAEATSYLSREFQIEADVESVSISILPLAVELQGISAGIGNESALLNSLSGSTAGEQARESLARTTISVERLELGARMLALLGLVKPSQFFSWFSVLSVEGVRFFSPDASILESLFAADDGQKSEASAQPLFAGYLSFFGLIPQKFEISQLHIEAGLPSDLNYVVVECESLTFVKGRSFDSAVIVRCQDSALKSSALPQTLAVLDLRVEARVRGDGQILIDKFNAEIDGIEANLSGQVRMPVSSGEGVTGKLKVTSDAEFRLMELVGVPASGTLNLEAELDLYPFSAFGRVAWVDGEIDDFDLYTGSASFDVDAAGTRVSELAIRTPLGGEILGAGKLDFNDAFSFRATAEVRQWPFLEMLRGFGPDSDAIDFKIDAPRLEVSGRGITESGRGFDLLILGPTYAKDLFVPPLDGRGAPGASLPDCSLQLRLYIFAKELDFDETEVRCFSAEDHLINVSKGRVFLDTGRTRFDLAAKGVDLAAVNYFADLDSVGIADLVGSILTDPTDGRVVFESSVEAKGLALGGFEFGKTQMQLRLGANGLTLTDVQATPPSGQELGIWSDRSFVSFSDLPSVFHIRSQGPLSQLQFLFPSLEGLQQLGGEMTSFDLATEMNISPFVLRSARGHFRLKNIEMPGFSVNEVESRLECIQGKSGCSDSFLRLSGVSLGWEDLSELPAGSGNVLVSVRALTSEWVDLGADLQDTTVNVRGQSDVSGRLIAQLNLAGPMTSPGVSGKIDLQDVLYLGQPIGDLQLSLAKTAESPLEGVFSAAYQQIYGRFIIPFDAASDATLFATAQDLDFMFLFPDARLSRNLYSEFSGNIEFKAPTPTSPLWKSDEWAREISARIVLNEALVAAQRLNISNSKPITIDVGKGMAKSSEIVFVSGDTNIAGDAEIDLLRRRLNARLNGRLDLGILQSLIPQVDASKGSADVDLNLEVERSKPPVLRGRMELDLKELLFADFDPAFENVSGRINLIQDRVEIAKLSGSKGSGTFEALGSAVFTSGEDGIVPEMSIRVRMNRLQTRFPTPIFRTADSVISGSIELKGNKRPYLLSGSVQVDRGRLYRDLTCEEIVEEAPIGEGRRIESDSQGFIDLDVVVEFNEAVSLQTRCIRSRLSSRLRIQGSESYPRFGGVISASDGRAQILKSQFEIIRAEVIFDTPLSFDPRLDVQMVSQIDNYQVFMSIDGYSRAPRTSFWSEPATTPSGLPIGRAEIIRMIASGRGPRDETDAEGNILANQVATYVYGSTELDDSLSRAFSKITAGFVDTVQLEPVIGNGQTSWKARISRSLGDRFNLGLDVEQGDLVNNQSLTGTLYLNDTVNVLGGFDRTVTELDAYFELSGGLRFRFGSN